MANCGLGKGKLSTINTKLCANNSAINNAAYNFNFNLDEFTADPVGSGILLCAKPAETAPPGLWYLTCAPQVGTTLHWWLALIG